MAMDEDTKKKLLYGGGAIASIVALVIYMKNRSASGGQSVSVPTGSSGAGGGSANSQAEAARINAATQLAIAQGSQDLQKQTLANQYNLGMAQIGGAVQVAKVNANASAMKSAFGPGGAGTAAAPAAMKAVGDTSKSLLDIVKGWFTPNPTTESAPPGGIQPGASGTPGDPGFIGPMPDPVQYNQAGEYIGAGSLAYDKAPDYFQGNIGGGSNDWFGSSPVDYVSAPTSQPAGSTDIVGQPFATNWGDYYPSAGEAPASGYSDYTPEQIAVNQGD
jgi:hypothetical protein